MIIDIEGTDGSGKATQTKLLYDYLTAKGKKCKIISFPNYDSISSGPVKMYLNGDLGKNEELDAYQISAIYAVDRVCTMARVKVEDYDYILFDRYAPSNMIHQSTKIKDLNEVDKFLDWVQDFEFETLKLPRPDKILFLNMPPKISIELAHSREKLKNGVSHDILEEDNAHLYKAYERAKYVSEKLNWTNIDCIDKNGKLLNVDEIHNKIVKVLNL